MSLYYIRYCMETYCEYGMLTIYIICFSLNPFTVSYNTYRITIIVNNEYLLHIGLVQHCTL